MSGIKPRRLLGTSDIQQALEELSPIATPGQVAVAGGVAMHFWGSERLTADIDLIARGPLPQHTYSSTGSLSFGGVKALTQAGIPFDWIQRDDDFAELYEEAAQFSRVVEGIPIRVASPEYLVAMKMVAGRPKDEIDLHYLITSGVLDMDKARRIIKRLLGAYALRDFNQHVIEAQWRASQEE